MYVQPNFALILIQVLNFCTIGLHFWPNLKITILQDKNYVYTKSSYEGKHGILKTWGKIVYIEVFFSTWMINNLDTKLY